ncbi:MAG: acyl-CoA thioesterase [Phycisphaeraceae bacterium]|nr:acyl-CoA thioesterase [Phycisphaeraceae bacterium]
MDKPERPPVKDKPGTSIDVRVRYAECDAQGFAHHSVYPIWMEMARTELLRQVGRDYRTMESEGVWFVVGRMQLRYRKPARYDDVVRIEVQTVRGGGSLIDHTYRILRGEELLTEASTTLVCIRPDGKPQRIPEELVC